MSKHACPCCGQRTLPERGAYEICPSCDWQDEGDVAQPWALSEVNGQSLWEAQLRVREPELSDAERASRLASLRAEEASRTKQELVAHLHAALGPLHLQFVPPEQADELSIRFWADRGLVEREYLSADEMTARLGALADTVPDGATAVLSHLFYDELVGAPRVPAVLVLRRWEAVMQTHTPLALFTDDLTTGLTIERGGDGFAAAGWGGLKL